MKNIKIEELKEIIDNNRCSLPVISLYISGHKAATRSRRMKDSLLIESMRYQTLKHYSRFFYNKLFK